METVSGMQVVVGAEKINALCVGGAVTELGNSPAAHLCLCCDVFGKTN